MSLFHHAIVLLLCGLCARASAEPLDEPLKPLPAVPQQDVRRVELGRRLFHEPRLSINNTLS